MEKSKVVSKKKKLSELAAMVGGKFSGNTDPIIDGVADLYDGMEGRIALAGDLKNISIVESSGASGFVVPSNMPAVTPPVIRCENPVLALTVIHQYYLSVDLFARSIHSTVVIGDNCQIPDQVSIGAGVIIGNTVKLGQRVILRPGVILGDDVCIDDDSEIHANVTIYQGSRLGKRVVILSGTVIGSDGFGYATNMETGQHVKRPHVGTVLIDDDVEIGSNTCVDRGTFGLTHIKQGTKIDNLVQIAHNCVIGENCLVVGQAGMAGSVTLGNNVILSGQVAIKDHATLGDGVIIAAKSGVAGDVEAGDILAGMPAIPVKTWRRAMVGFKEIPSLIRDLRRLKKRVEVLED